MLRVGGYVFKRAETSDELDQIHALNYRTFVGELAQYPDAGAGRLVDKFHHKNIYFIALSGPHVVGMVSVHGQPPFSIAERLPDPGMLQRPDMRPLEVRLLAVDQEKRNSIVLAGLVYALYMHASENGITHLFISGVKERLSLYEQLGFEAVGPAVSAGKALFVPMVCPVSAIKGRKQRLFELWFRRIQKRSETSAPPENAGPALSPAADEETRERPAWEVATAPLPRRKEDLVCLLPGPVTIAPAVHAAFQRVPIYHRGPEFLAVYEKVREQLARMTRSRQVAILNGSGTLANEVVAATLAAEPQSTRGLLLVNGEFGQRLARQAARFGLSFDTLTWTWGEPWDLAAVERQLRGEPRIDWVWGVHQESSTGVLNDLAGLVETAKRSNCRVCVDCISSLGATPLDLRDVYLATGATGKALGSYAGSALIFADVRRLEHLDLSRTPSYLDLPAALRATGPRYTFPSSTLCALQAALEGFATPEMAEENYERYRLLGQYVRTQLRQIGLPPLAKESCAAPVITSFAPPHDEASEPFVARCHFWGYAIGGASGYLQERRLVQIATMGAIRQEDFAALFDRLREYLSFEPSCRTPVAAEVCSR
jgi:aspartate aminotransferase-like enzyme